MTRIWKLLATHFPNLPLQLAQARSHDTPEEYLRKTFIVAAMTAAAICLILFFFTSSLFAFLFWPLLLAVTFTYFFNLVQMRIQKINKQISREIVFAGRFLIIELESGVPLYNAFKNLSKNYETTGKFFAEIIERVDLGTSLEEAINEAVNLAPSNDLRRLFWQVLNSLKTGSEVASALNNVFDQIVREQQISVKEYGRKLNPMAMFYMMIAIIIPSLGTIMLIVLSTFIGIDLNMLFFSLIIIINIILQFMFLGIIKSQRPPVDI